MRTRQLEKEKLYFHPPLDIDIKAIAKKNGKKTATFLRIAVVDYIQRNGLTA